MIERLLFIIALFTATATAQYRFDNWTADEGLPQNSIYAIKQTRDGYIWLATLDGLVRFDGVRFTVFNKSNSPGIKSNRFVELFEDASGDLWAATEESDVVRLHNGHFSSYGNAEGVLTDLIALSGDADGNILILFSNGQMIRFVNGKFSAFDFASNFSQKSSIVRSRSVAAIHPPVAGTKFVYCFVDGHRLQFPFSNDSGDDTLLSAAQDVNGTLWILTGKGKLERVENGELVRTYGMADGLPKYPAQFLLGAKLRLISRDEQGSLRLTDLETMRSELLLKKSSLRETGDVFTSSQDGEQPIFRAFEDIEGNIWLGTTRNGLYRARKKVVTAFSTADGLTNNNVYPIYDDKDGTLWVGTARGLFTFQNGRFAQIESTENFYVNAIGKTPDGRILISDHGILYVREGNRFVPFMPGQLSTSTEIYLIYSDRENALWIGGNSGLTRLLGGAVTTFTTGNELAGNDVKVIIEAQSGGLWIGTYGGLSRYQNGQLTSWTENEGLPSRTIRSLYEDADGILWIGSYDGGLARFKDGKFTGYNSSIGLFNDGVFQILEDKQRNFWINSNRGIYRVRHDELNEFADGTRKTITSIAYGKSDGMLNIEGNGGHSPAGVKTQDGRLWFPTQDGIAMIDPTKITVNSRPPSVVIESVKIDNADSIFWNSDFGLDKEKSAVPNPESRIQIEPSQQSFEIQYTALSFINPENLRFKYKLEGLDDDWVDAANRRTAYFSHVPPGVYTFRVIAANSDGIWNETGASLKITILPPFYRTWWFIVLSASAVAALAYFLFNRRIAQLERERTAQQTFSRQLIASQELERKRIAAELHDSLGQRLVVIKNLALMFLNRKNGGEKSQIEEISAEASQAIGEVKAISYNLRPYQLDRIGLTKAIEAIIRSARAASEIDFTMEIGDIDDYFPKDDEINFYRIVQECINNILKHSGASKVFVVIKRAGKTLELEIGDDGKGFGSAQPEKTGGFGLIGIVERAELLGGKVELKSAPEHGAVIRLLIKK